MSELSAIEAEYAAIDANLQEVRKRSEGTGPGPIFKGGLKQEVAGESQKMDILKERLD